MKIIHPNADNTLAIIMPVEGCGLTIEQIAQKDVPYGVPYLILEDGDLPSDWSFSAAWEADFSSHHGIGLGAQRWFIAQSQAAIAAGENIEANEVLIAQMQAEIVQLEGAAA